MEESTKIREEHSISGEEFLFFTGLGLLILYFILAHPSTPNFRYSTVVFWMAATILVLVIAPDYLNYQVTQQWLIKHKDSKIESLYKKVYHIAQERHRYLKPTNLFCATLLLTLTAMAILLFTGNVAEVCFGASYGLLMKAILSPTPKNNSK